MGVLLSTCGPRGVKNIVIKGSDTEVNLVLQLAETYMKKDSAVSISVTGGGSGSGIASLINGKIDIANSSRPFKESELQLAKDRGINPRAIIFAVDALALIVNPAIEIESLTLEQIGGIYNGEITNWQEVGGQDQPISLYGRQSNSGTFVFFRENIVKGEYASAVKQMNGTAQIVESIKVDRAGIGYVGIGYVVNKSGEVSEGIKVLKVKADTNEPAAYPANAEAINDGTYPITRPLFQYVDGEIEGELKAFIQFELTEEGQNIVGQNGYFPIKEEHRKHNQELGIAP